MPNCPVLPRENATIGLGAAMARATCRHMLRTTSGAVVGVTVL